jgi:hypothetical protein
MDMKRASLAAALAFAALMLALPARADGPAYADTLIYIRSLLDGTLVEQGHCTFVAKSPAKGRESTFRARDLTVVPSALSPHEVRFDCEKDARCVTFSAGSDHAASFLNLAVHGDAPGVATAISRLIEMCGDTLPIN